MRLRVGLLIATTLATIVLFGFVVRQRWPALQMAVGAALLVLVALLAFEMFLLSLFREPWP